MRISDWSSDLCSSDLRSDCFRHHQLPHLREAWERGLNAIEAEAQARHCRSFAALETAQMDLLLAAVERGDISDSAWDHIDARLFWKWRLLSDIVRSEEHTSELQSLMRNSYAVFCLKNKNRNDKHIKAKHKKTT